MSYKLFYSMLFSVARLVLYRLNDMVLHVVSLTIYTINLRIILILH